MKYYSTLCTVVLFIIWGCGNNVQPEIEVRNVLNFNSPEEIQNTFDYLADINTLDRRAWEEQNGITSFW